ncbi:hypothetical protein D9M73_122330 [compost metagenome]
MAEIGWPPVLRFGHQREDVGLHCRQIEALKRLGIIEIGVHRVAGGRVLVEHRQVQLVRPPQTVGHFEQDGVAIHLARTHRAFRFGIHGSLHCGFWLACAEDAMTALIGEMD